MPTRKMRPPAQTTKMAAATAPVERIIRKVLGQRGSPAELRKRAKGDRQKVQLAARLRAQTTVTVAWIAARLAMGTPGYLNNRLYRWRKGLLE